jgi:benzoyl-CoA reductase subunit C
MNAPASIAAVAAATTVRASARRAPRIPATRASPIERRLDALISLARRSGARGVVFYDVKFCEPELFDLPALRSGLQESGLPSLAIEVDLSDPLPEQARTRLEAFLEMIA